MNNMIYYKHFAEVPETAKKVIGGGKLRGMTDINPMWRIQMLTEAFGPCDIGWYTEKVKEWTEAGPDGRIAAFVDINLYVKIDGDWSKPILGTGGSMLCDIEKGSPVTSDEAYKMAYTDAISVACKALGMGADVYWSAGRQTKYDIATLKEEPKPVEEPKRPITFICAVCGKDIKGYKTSKGMVYADEHIKKSMDRFGRKLCVNCYKAAAEKEKAVAQLQGELKLPEGWPEQ